MDKLHNPSLLVDVAFEKDRVDGGFSTSKMDCDVITVDDITSLIEDVESVKNYYSSKTILDGVIVSVRYKRIAPKSERIQRLLCHEKEAYLTTIGAKYEEQKIGDGIKYNHVITHYLSKYELIDTLNDLIHARSILKKYYDGRFFNYYLDKGNREKQTEFFKNEVLCKTNFYTIMCDISYIKNIFVLTPESRSEKKEILVTFFPLANANLEVFLRRVNIEGDIKILDDCNAILTKDQYNILFDKAPYVICMENDDFSNYQIEDDSDIGASYGRELPKVDDSIPTIGVFDTIIEKQSYLTPYIEYENLVSEAYYDNPENIIHGTRVDSIIIEGNKLNPKYEDDCGLFKVLHFGVGGKHTIEIDVLFKALEDKVKKYCSRVKVWNLSLGDEVRVHPYYVSLLGAKIDEISKKYNVLFVIAGTNTSKKYQDPIIGSPADSFNAIVVNSVKRNGSPAS